MWQFVEDSQYTYTQGFGTIWDILLFVVLAVSLFLIALNSTRKDKGNKMMFRILNGLIAINAIGSVAFNGVAVSSFLIVALGVILLFNGFQKNKTIMEDLINV